MVFHCARRLRVLLRDIFRLGTATSALLSVFYSVFEIKFCERTPAGVHSVAVPVVGPGHGHGERVDPRWGALAEIDFDDRVED